MFRKIRFKISNNIISRIKFQLRRSSVPNPRITSFSDDSFVSCLISRSLQRDFNSIKSPRGPRSGIPPRTPSKPRNQFSSTVSIIIRNPSLSTTYTKTIMCVASTHQSPVSMNHDHVVKPCRRCGYNVLEGDQCGNCGTGN